METLNPINNELYSITFDKTLFIKFANYIDVKQTTLKGYVVCIRQFAKWLSENDVNQPIREDIKNYKRYLDDKGFKAGTKAQYLRAVKQFFKWTYSEGLYPNIADNIKGAKVKQDNTKKEAFSEEDIKTILKAIDISTETGKRDYSMILLSVTGGLRIIEMQRANVSDVQIINGQRVLYIQGKGHDDKDDYIKLCNEVSKIIDDYLLFRNANKSDPLFTGTGNRAKGKRLSEPSISRIIKERFKIAGFDCDKLTAHSLRHTSNTLLFKTGADLYTVQQHARHSNPKTTEIYIHTLEKQNDQSEQIIYNQIFNPSKTTPLKEITRLSEGLSIEQQQNILDYIKDIISVKKTG